MAPRPAAAILRWIHHRNSSDYRELQESILGCGVGFLGKSPRSWKTVPGLILEDDSAIIFDDFSRPEVMRLKGRSSLAGGRSSTAFSRVARSPATSRTSKRSPSFAGEAKMSHDNESKVYDSRSIETTETEDESEQEEPQYKRDKCVRWADRTGQDLAVTISIDSLPYVSTRVVILLLDLDERLFEFVQCEFDTDNRLTVTDVLKQLHSFASIDYLAQQRFRTLCRPDEEFLNMLPLQNYHVREGEILVASGGNAKPKDVMAAASALLAQKKLARAVQKAKLSGRALQRLLSSAELEELLEKGRPVNNPDKTTTVHESAEAPEDQEPEDDSSALVVKVLSRELGEDFVHSDFADFSFPIFDAEAAFAERDDFFDFERSCEKAGPGWFDEILAHPFSDEEGSIEFSADALPELDETTHDDVSTEVVTSDPGDEPRIDPFGSSSHAWGDQDAVVPDFSTVDGQRLYL